MPREARSSRGRPDPASTVEVPIGSASGEVRSGRGGIFLGYYRQIRQWGETFWGRRWAASSNPARPSPTRPDPTRPHGFGLLFSPSHSELPLEVFEVDSCGFVSGELLYLRMVCTSRGLDKVLGGKAVGLDRRGEARLTCVLVVRGGADQFDGFRGGADGAGRDLASHRRRRWRWSSSEEVETDSCLGLRLKFRPDPAKRRQGAWAHCGARRGLCREGNQGPGDAVELSVAGAESPGGAAMKTPTSLACA